MAPRKRRSLARAVVGVVVGGGCLYLAARQVDFSALVEALRQVDLPLLGAAVVLLLLGQLARALCWSALVGGRRLPFLVSARLVLAGNVANLFVPMRGGEVARVWLLSRRGGVPAEEATTTVLVERTADMVILGCLIAAATVLVGMPEGATTGAARVAAAAAVAVFAVAALYACKSLIARVGARLSRRVHVLGALCERLARGLEMLRARSAALGVLALVASWALVLVGLDIRLRAFGVEVPLGGALVVLAAGNVAASLPLSPAGIGIFEAAVVYCLTYLGVPHTEAFVFAVASHALTIAILAAVGALAFAVDQLLGGADGDAAPEG